jgi:hypothetical protein
MTRALGYLPSASRAHDKSFAEHHEQLLGGALPTEDERFLPHLGRIWDQGGAEQCVGVSLAQNCAIQLAYEGHSAVDFSGSFPWWCSRLKHGDAELNVGTYIGTAVDAIREEGLPPDKFCPTESAQWDFAKRPSQLAFTNAFPRKFGVELFRVGLTHDEVKAALLVGPLTWGTLVTRAFTQDSDGKTTWGPPRAGEEVAGGHAMSLVAFYSWGCLVKQTWGLLAGALGMMRVSWDYVLDGDYTSEVVCVRRVPRTGAGT